MRWPLQEGIVKFLIHIYTDTTDVPDQHSFLFLSFLIFTGINKRELKHLAYREVSRGVCYVVFITAVHCSLSNLTILFRLQDTCDSIKALSAAIFLSDRVTSKGPY